MMVLTRLLILEPGTFESHPDMGVGLISRFRYSMSGTEYELRSEYRRQIDKYLPTLQGAEVEVQFKDKQIYIAVTVDGYMYNFQYDIGSNEINSNYVKLSEI